MKEFIKNHFKFIFIITWFTFFVSDISKEIFKKNELINSNVMSIDYMQEKNIECLLARLDKLEKNLNEINTTIGISTELLFDEIRMLNIYEYITYSEIIKALNYYHTNEDCKAIDFGELSLSIYKNYFDVKKEKINQKMEECKEKNIKIETH